MSASEARRTCPSGGPCRRAARGRAVGRHGSATREVPREALVSAVFSCDNLLTVPQAMLDPAPVGRLDEVRRAELDRALRYALDIRY
jgi:hypothetical protein